MRAPLRLTTYTLLIVFALPVVVPLLWMLSVALRGNDAVFSIPLQLVPPEFTFAAVGSVLRDPDVLRLFLNSYVIAIVVTLICVVFASLAGYGLARYRFRGRRVVVLYVLMTQMFPLVLLAVPYFLLITRVGLYDTYPALVLANASFALPFCILMLRDFAEKIPRELDEAAAIDGCSPFRTYLSVILPVMRPGLVATGVYAFILSWNEFLFAVVLTNTTASRPLTVGIAQLQGEFSTFWNEIMAMSLLGTIPLVVAFLLVQRHLVSGLTSGSVKA